MFTLGWPPDVPAEAPDDAAPLGAGLLGEAVEGSALRWSAVGAAAPALGRPPSPEERGEPSVLASVRPTGTAPGRVGRFEVVPRGSRLIAPASGVRCTEAASFAAVLAAAEPGSTAAASLDAGAPAEGTLRSAAPGAAWRSAAGVDPPAGADASGASLLPTSVVLL